MTPSFAAAAGMVAEGAAAARREPSPYQPQADGVGVDKRDSEFDLQVCWSRLSEGKSFSRDTGCLYTCEYAVGRRKTLLMLVRISGSVKPGVELIFFHSGSAMKVAQFFSRSAMSANDSM